MAEYYCNACGRTVQRDSEKRWIKSYCETTWRASRLWRRVSPTGSTSEENEA